jgi:hypothetical protein
MVIISLLQRKKKNLFTFREERLDPDSKFTSFV